MTVSSRQTFPLDQHFYAPQEKDAVDASQASATPTPPRADIQYYLIDGTLIPWTGKTAAVYTPIVPRGSAEKIQIGSYPMLGKEEAIRAAEAAHRAFNHGRGVWPQMTPTERIRHVRLFLDGLRREAGRIAELIMWEICKTAGDAKKEVDRTIQYIEDTIAALEEMDAQESHVKNDGGVAAHIRRTPLGVTLCCAPFNYPLNETYTTLIPALIMGNTVVIKVPRTGVLCHQPTYEIFAQCFPKGVVNIITGSGRETFGPIMATGLVNVFAFIGTSDAANDIMKHHPKPHRLRMSLGLEAKNPGIIMPDANIEKAVAEAVMGSLSYNGQRCTALKLLFVHDSIASEFVAKFVHAVDALPIGLPWEPKTFITPLPEPEKPAFIKTLMEDALSKGAKVVNPRGGIFDRTFVTPTVVFPVTPQMRCFHEEQFGPLVPIATFKDVSEVVEHMVNSQYGQQVSVFGKNEGQLAEVVDVLTHLVARVNINTQCQRGPDSYPFTGRKDSASGTLSVAEALESFCIRSMVATKDADLLPTLSKMGSKFVRVQEVHGTVNGSAKMGGVVVAL
ncbi:hypothetical protein HK102_012233 [Quaeritorhiza haematococci]|nr:hypothetical protein HK102_012233 [Quaeritorhiza haematococci]